MVEFFRPTEADYAEQVDLANQIFRGNVAEDGTFTYNERYFQDLLPKLYADGSSMKDHYSVRQDGRIVAQVGAFPDTMVVAGHELSTRGIGTVGVDRNYRKNGYMIKLMDWVMEEMVRDGVDFSALGGRRQRYEHWNFTIGGINAEFEFIPNNADAVFGKGHRFGYSFVPVTDAADPALERMFALHEKQPARYLRAREKFFDILRTWSLNIYQIVKEERFCGYLIMNSKRISISEMLLENEDEIGAILNDLVRETGAEIRLSTHPWQVERIAWLEENAEHCRIFMAENLCVLRFRRVLQAFFDLKSTFAQLADGELTVAIDNGETLKITVKDNKATVEEFDGEAQISLEQMRATRLFFSHQAFVAMNTAALPVCAQSWFPLPFSVPSPDRV